MGISRRRDAGPDENLVGWRGRARDADGQPQWQDVPEAARYSRRRSDREPAAPAYEFGPYDVKQAPDDGVSRLDLGALRVPVLPGIEVQLQANANGEMHQVVLGHASGRLRLGAYAAPRSEGVWDEIRAQLRAALAKGGAEPVEVPGDYGPELRAQVPEPSGPVNVRHVGIDGPRWFVHAMFIGDAASGGVLDEVLRGLIVDRGDEARPVREPLPLRLPPQLAAQLAAQAPPRGNAEPGAPFGRRE